MSDDDGGSGSEASTSLARGRSRRTRNQGSAGRLDALEKLRSLRGAKNKYEVKEVQSVYDVVDESTYSRTVHERQKDDWIVDDGSGYVEDGREIFDDDLNDLDDDDKHRRKSKNKKDKKAKKEERDSHRAAFHSIRDMLGAMPTKRKRAEATEVQESSSKVSEEDLLGDLMKELHADKKPRTSTGGTSLREKTRMADNFLEASKIRSPVAPSPKPTVVKKKFTSYVVRNDIQDDPDRFTSRKSNSGYGNDSYGNSSPPSFIDDDSMDAMMTGIPEVVETPCPVKKASEGTKSSMKVDPPKVATPVTPAISKPQPAPSKPKTSIDKSRFSEIESFESFGQLSIDNSKPGNGATDTSEMGLLVDGDSDESKVLNFYWLDMYEEPKNPGSLYLFGKVQATKNNYSSCCVIVKNLPRCIYLLPKNVNAQGESISLDDVYEEFNDVIAPKYRINEFKSRPVKKKYCFELTDVPTFGDYVEVRYSGALPSLPSDLQGETFSHVFGSSSPLMENFLLDKKLKGPSWLQIKNPEQVEGSQQHSWSKFEFTCTVASVKPNPETLNMAIPPVVLASVNIQSVNDASSKKDTIVFVGVAVNKNFQLQAPLKPNELYHDYFCFVNKPPGEIWPLDVDLVFPKEKPNSKNVKMDSERAMLGCFLAKLQQIDADVYLGHDLNFDLLLLHLLNLKVPHWSRIGRLKRSTLIGKNSKTLDYKAVLAGRLFCDVKISAMELIRARSYELQSLATQVLGMKEGQVESLTGPEMKQLFESSDGLNYFIQWGMQHCVLNIRLVNELQVMPLALQITAIAGNTLFRTLLGGRSERNEYLLLHAFHSKDYIVPDKFKPFNKNKGDGDGEHGEDKKGKKSSGPAYAGGMVLDPKKGFYDNFIVLMDFNSLYPSIIQEYNICFTTNTHSEEDSQVEEKDRGILPDEIRKLVESRKQVKGMMKGDISADMMRQYDIRQKALKLTANSMYGCLGFRNSRFYAKELAALITGKGRDILVRTKEAVEQMGFEVIYGDTDSLMINSNTQDIQKVYQIGNTIKSEINKMYKLLELEIDGVFRFLLLLKKKKYAALLYNRKPNGEVETTLEMKGLDMVRRDWAPIASNTARLILDEIMTEQSLDDKIFKICKVLNEVSAKLREGNVLLKELLITKQLAKNPEDYKDAQGLYHVQVALRMNKSGDLHKRFKNGDTVSYLFCTDSLPHHLTELTNVKKAAAKPEESGTTEDVKEAEPLQPDPEYYLSQQVHPVVSRICEPIPGLDGARIAEALGMDPTAFKKRRVVEDHDEDKTLGQQTEVEKYAGCKRFTMKCVNPACRTEIKWDSPFVGQGMEIQFALVKCPACSQALPINHVVNRLTLFIRTCITKYYKNVYICEDPTCDNVQRAVPIELHNGYPQCQKCWQGLMCKDYTDPELYRQLTFFTYLLDVKKHAEELGTDTEKAMIAKLEKEGEGIRRFNKIRAVVSRALESSGYSQIKLGYIFETLFPKKNESVV